MVWIINRCKAKNLGDLCIGKVLTNEVRKKGFKAENLEYLGEEPKGRLYNLFTRTLSKLHFNNTSLLLKILSVFLTRKKPSLIIIGGGQLLLNNDNFLSSLMFWTVLSRIYRIPVVLFSVGTEERGNYTYLDKSKLKIALKISKKTYLRDLNTVKIIQKLVGDVYEPVPDVVTIMDKETNLSILDVHNSIFIQKYKKIINQFDHRPSNQEKYFEYVFKHVESEIKCNDVITYSSYKDKDTSILFSSWLKDNKNLDIDILHPKSLKDIFSIISSSKKVYSTRMHPLIFSKVYGVNFKAIPLNNKIIEMEKYLNDRELTEIKKQTEKKINEILKLRNEYTVST